MVQSDTFDQIFKFLGSATVVATTGFIYGVTLNLHKRKDWEEHPFLSSFNATIDGSIYSMVASFIGGGCGHHSAVVTLGLSYSMLSRFCRHVITPLISSSPDNSLNNDNTDHIESSVINSDETFEI